ncbi:MAG: FAD-dependent oxidoreductase, partial [Bradymonadaceae bacterium]
MLGMDPIPGVQITLITRDLYMSYSGMLPGLIAGHYEFDEAHVDLRRLAQFAGARMYHTEAVELDLEAQRVHCNGRPPVDYDTLSINIGSNPRTDGIPGAAEQALPVKPLDEFLDAWADLRRSVVDNDGDPHRIAVVGAGAGGTELTLATQYRLHRELEDAGASPDRVTYRLFSADETILPNQPSGARRKFERVLDERDVDVRTDAPVARVD